MADIRRETVEQLAKERWEKQRETHKIGLPYEEISESKRVQLCDKALADIHECFPSIEAAVKERLLSNDVIEVFAKYLAGWEASLTGDSHLEWRNLSQVGKDSFFGFAINILQAILSALDRELNR